MNDNPLSLSLSLSLHSLARHFLVKRLNASPLSRPEMQVRDIQSRLSRPISRPVGRKRPGRGIGARLASGSLFSNAWSLTAVEGQTLERSNPIALGSQRRDRCVLLRSHALRWRECSRSKLILSAGKCRGVWFRRRGGSRRVGGPYRTWHISKATVVVWLTRWGEGGSGSLVAKGRHKGPLERSPR